MIARTNPSEPRTSAKIFGHIAGNHQQSSFTSHYYCIDVIIMLAVPTQVVVSTGQEQIDYHRCLRTLMSHLAPEKVPEVERDVASYLQLRQGALDAIKTGPTDLGLQAILRYNFHMNNLGIFLCSSSDMKK